MGPGAALGGALARAARLELRAESDPRATLGRAAGRLAVLDGAGAELAGLRVESVSADLEMGAFEARVLALPGTAGAPGGGPAQEALRLERMAKAHFLSPCPGSCTASLGDGLRERGSGAMRIVWPAWDAESSQKYSWRVEAGERTTAGAGTRTGTGGGRGGPPESRTLLSVRAKKWKPDFWLYMSCVCALPTAGIAACMGVRRALKQPSVETLLAADLETPLGCALELRGCGELVSPGATFSLAGEGLAGLAPEQRLAALVALVYSFAHRACSLPESSPELL